MKYNTKTEDGLRKFRKRGKALINNGAIVELVEVKDDGTNQQRKYFHALLREVARDQGITFKLFKEAIIIHLGYYVDILGEKVRQHTSDMNKKQYSNLIDDFFNWTIDQGYEFPTCEEYSDGDLD